MIDTLALSGAVHSLAITGTIAVLLAASVIFRSRTGVVLTIAVGGAILF